MFESWCDVEKSASILTSSVETTSRKREKHSSLLISPLSSLHCPFCFGPCLYTIAGKHSLCPRGCISITMTRTDNSDSLKAYCVLHTVCLSVRPGNLQHSYPNSFFKEESGAQKQLRSLPEVTLMDVAGLEYDTHQSKSQSWAGKLCATMPFRGDELI